MPQLQSDFQKLYADRLPYLNRLIGPDDWKEVEQQWESYFRIEPSSKMREEMLMWGGFGLFREIPENDAITYDKILQGPNKVFTHALYGLGFEIGFLADENDLDGIIKKNAPELGRSMRMSIQTLAATFFNNAFAGSLTADGQYFFDTDHTYVRGAGTWQNRPTVLAALGQSALESGIISFASQKDLMGNPMPMQVNKLVIPPALAPVAHELTQSILRSDTSTNAANFIKGTVTTEVWPFLTTSTQWMLSGPKEQSKVFWFWRLKPRTSHGYDFEREVAKTKTLFSCSLGAVTPHGWYGSYTT